MIKSQSINEPGMHLGQVCEAQQPHRRLYFITHHCSKSKFESRAAPKLSWNGMGRSEGQEARWRLTVNQVLHALFAIIEGVKEGPPN